MSLRTSKLAQAALGGPSTLGRGSASQLNSSASSSSRSEAEALRSTLASLPIGPSAASPSSTPVRVASPSPPRGGACTPRGGASTPRGGVSTPRGGASTPRGGGASSRAGTPRQRRADGKENGEEGVREEVKVVVRVRPPLEKGRALAYFADDVDRTKLVSTPLEGSAVSNIAAARNVAVEEFGFSRVIAPVEDNSQTFEALGLRELIAGVGQGFQETIFAYGQTGSGKTHTILGSGGASHLMDDCSGGGDRQRRSEPGLLQLCTRELFNAIFNSCEKDTRRYIQLMCLEIKNEDIIDLLPLNIGGGSGGTPRSGSGASTPRGSAAGRPRTMHTTQDTISIKGKRTVYRKVTTWNYEETMWLLREAIASREVGTSSLNSESSRSHMVIRFYVKTLSLSDAAGAGSSPEAAGVIGSLTLVDLAGNERESSDNFFRKGEAKAINVSLTHLNRMLLKMQNGQLDESDRRQGTLNMILYDSLREDCGATMIFCIHPDRRFALSARSTLQMAVRCRRIVRQKKVRRLEAVGYSSELADLRLEASRLTQAHTQALETRLKKEEELQRTAEQLRDLRERYAEKTKDCEALRANLANRYERMGEEQEKQELMDELERRDGMMKLMCEQMRELELQIAEKDKQQERRDKEMQRKYEELAAAQSELRPGLLRGVKGVEVDGARLSRKVLVDTSNTLGEESGLGKKAGGEEINFSKKALVDEAVHMQLASLARAVGEGVIEDRCQALEKAYRDELQSVKEAHARELRSLKDALQQQGIAAEASAGSSAGEPCSEPSMGPQSSKSSGFGDDETLTASRRSIEQAASPQKGIGRHSYGTGELDAEWVPAVRRSSHRSTRWSQSDAGFFEDATSASSKVERVLANLQHALGQDGGEPRSQAEPFDAQPFEVTERHVGQLCWMALQARIEPQHRARTVDLALKAAQRHGNSLMIRRDVAKLLLQIGSKDSTMKEAMIAKGAIRLTVDTLHFLLSLFPASGVSHRESSTSASAAEVCSASFRLLAALFMRHRGDQSTARAALDAVLRCLAVPQLLQQHGNDTEVNGCYLVMTLVDKRPAHQELVRTSDGIKLLLRLLDAEVITLENETKRRSPDETCVVGQASATLCYYIAGCLAKVVQENLKNQQALYELGGITLLLRTLRTCLQSAQVVGNACMAIAFIAKGHEPSQHAARNEDAVQLILDALLAYRGENSVQIGVCRAIATLTDENAANQQAFLQARLQDGDLETGAVELLLEALDLNRMEEPLVTTMCWALSNLTAGNPLAMDLVCQLDGLEVVVSLLQRFAKEERACEYLCRFISELVRGPSVAAQRNRQKLRTLGAKEAITTMAQHHARSEGFVLVRVRDALQNLNVQEKDIRRSEGTTAICRAG